MIAKRTHLARGMRRNTLIAATVGLVALACSRSAHATPPDPATECVKPNVTCVAPGSGWHTQATNALNAGNDVYLTDQNLTTEDMYTFPGAGSQRLRLNFDNQTIRGEGMDNTQIQRDGSNTIFEIRAGGNAILDLHMSNAQNGVRIVGPDYDNVIIGGVHGTNMPGGIAEGEAIYFQKSDKPGNSAPNIWIRNSLFENTKLVIHFDAFGQASQIGPEQKYVGIDGCTFRGIRDNGNGLVIDSPYDVVNGVYLGAGDITRSTMEDSDNNWTLAFLDNLGGGGTGIRTVVGAPSNMVEWNVTGSTLADYGIGINNKEEDPVLNPYGRPILGPGGTNPSVGPEYAPQGHAGAFYPAGDANKDNQLTNPDFQAFRTAYNAPSPSTRTLSINDFDGDGVISLSDFDVFLIGYTDAVALNVDRDGNGIGDLEDILSGRFADDDNNGLPDELEYACVSDGDGGNVIHSSGEACNGIDCYMDYCIEDTLTEYLCDSGTFATRLYDCALGCLNGACRGATPNTCEDPDAASNDLTTQTTVTAYLTFDDGGKLIPSKESLFPPEELTDRCLDGSTLREYYCDGSNQIAYTDNACANGCQDGACVQPGGARDQSPSPKRARHVALSRE